MFITLKGTVGDYKIKEGRKVETFASRWLIAQYTEFHEQGTKKVVPRHGKRLISGHEQWDGSALH
jgi:hypothetical protein